MRSIVTILLLGVLLVGCSLIATSPSKIRVVATLHPLADLVREIGGERVEVMTLIPAGASPHAFEPTSGAILRAKGADLLVYMGAGLDDWASEFAGEETLLLCLSEGMELPDGDPHVWLDPVLVKEALAPQMAQALSEIAPDSSDYFRGNLRRLQRELERLHAEIRAALATVEVRAFITLHAAWGPFARRYQLEDICIEEFPAAEPSAARLASLVRSARERGVRAVLVEPGYNPRPAEVLASEIGGQVYEVDPLGGEGLPGRERYLDLMRYNLQIFVSALR